MWHRTQCAGLGRPSHMLLVCVTTLTIECVCLDGLLAYGRCLFHRRQIFRYMHEVARLVS